VVNEDIKKSLLSFGQMLEEAREEIKKLEEMEKAKPSSRFDAEPDALLKRFEVEAEVSPKREKKIDQTKPYDIRRFHLEQLEPVTRFNPLLQ
jgi:hypothetical protein